MIHILINVVFTSSFIDVNFNEDDIDCDESFTYNEDFTAHTTHGLYFFIHFIPF